MLDFDILHELFTEEALIVIEKNHYGKKVAILHEPEPEDAKHPGYAVTINGMPETALVIKADKFPAPNTIFNNHKGACKRADFIIIAQAKGKNWIVYIEMKHGKGNSEKEIILQLQGAQCLIAYCRAIGQIFWKQSDFLNPEIYQSRFVSIREIGLPKKPTRLSSGLNDKPEKMLKISSPHYLEFNRIIGKV